MLLEVTDVWKKLGPSWALRGVSFTCRGPGLLAIEGPNGSGKSTLARVILGIHKPTRGRVRVAGVDPARRPGRVQRLVAHALEGAWLPPYASGLELALEYAAARGLPEEWVIEEAEALGVTGYWGRRVYSYSMGMRKRLLLSMALADRRAPVLLLDEPYTLLDPGAREELAERLVDAAQRRLVIVITHISTRAEERASSVLRLEEGRVVEWRGSC